MGKKQINKSDPLKKNRFSMKQSLFEPIALFFISITNPIRTNKAWLFLRRTILRSPFRGYFVGSFRELKNVTWPDRSKSVRLTFAVIVFSVAFSLFAQALDFGFEKLARKLFLS